MLLIGEKINTIRKCIARAVENRDAEFIQKEAINQVAAGIDVLDVNVGSPFHEAENMRWAVRAIEEVVNIPLCLDSSSPEAIRAGFEVCRDKEKAWYCEQNNIDLHIDDTAEYGKYFKTPFYHLVNFDSLLQFLAEQELY